MTKYKALPLRRELVVFPDCGEKSNGGIGVHSQKERRYKCHECGKTFSDSYETPLYGLKYAQWVGDYRLDPACLWLPLQAIVVAFAVDERTVSDWQDKVGKHVKRVQEAVVCTGQVGLGQVQGDEFYVKTQVGCLAPRKYPYGHLCLFAALGVGAVSIERNGALVIEVMAQVKAAALPNQPILWATDGFSAWLSAILTVFCTPVYTGNPERSQQVVWPDLHIIQVIKSHTGRYLTSVERRLVYGSQQAAEALVFATQVGWDVFNTAYIERLNAMVAF